MVVIMRKLWPVKQRELFTTNQMAGGVEKRGDVANLATNDVKKMTGSLDPTTSHEIV